MAGIYNVKTTPIKNAPGTWNSLLVEILDGENKKIGEYIRTYPTLYNTFVPFHKNGCDYALYSRDYTRTSVMRLPDCVEIAIEEKKYYRRDYRLSPDPDFKEIISKEEYDLLVAEDDANGVEYKYRRGHVREGFCPVDFYVPTEYHEDEPDCIQNENLELAFVAGCIWGDDTSWKIQHLDLSRIENGIITRDDRYGYLELAHGISLKDAITVWQEQSHEYRINIATNILYDVDMTGEIPEIEYIRAWHDGWRKPE